MFYIVGTRLFIFLLVAAVMCWIGGNTLAPSLGYTAIDPPPFHGLEMIALISASCTAVAILATQIGSGGMLRRGWKKLTAKRTATRLDESRRPRRRQLLRSLIRRRTGRQYRHALDTPELRHRPDLNPRRRPIR